MLSIPTVLYCSASQVISVLVLLHMVNTMYNIEQLRLKADRCSFKLAWNLY